MHYTTEFGYSKLQRLVFQHLSILLINVANNSNIVIDFQPIRPQIQHPLRRTTAPSDYEIVDHPLHLLETTI